MKRATRQPFKCIDGPFKGRTIWLSTDSKSFVFTVKGQTGRYIGGIWHAQVS